MSDDTQNQVDESAAESQDAQPSEREMLMERADDMGISYSKNIKTETLRDRVNEKISGKSESDEAAPSAGAKTETEAQAKNRKRREAQEKAGKLVRVKIACMNPNKRNHEGEYFSAANSLTGTFTKYVPYGVEWHVPQIILNMIQARKVAVRVDRTVDGNKVKVTRLIPEFSIEILPPLTEEEMKQLRLEQARRSGNSNE